LVKVPLLVTALNSAPVIFYPTDTFAELEPRFFAFPDGNYGRLSARRIIHIVGIVAEWLVQYLKRTGHAVRIPKKDFYPVGNCAAGGQTGTEAWQPPLEARLLCYGVQPGHGLSVFHVETSWTRGVAGVGDPPPEAERELRDESAIPSDDFGTGHNTHFTRRPLADPPYPAHLT